jgi:hypothetical protein
MKKLLLTLLLCLFATASHSDHKPLNLVPSEMPVWCGLPADTEKYVRDHNYTPISISFGRVGASADGEVVFASIIYINMENDQLIPMMITPDGSQSCLIYITFNFSLNEEVKEQFKEYIK